ncbi:hypothetical protein N0V82_005351 [Gnomoniopsis sp. IMI 355080]|nr:hypothetical protein N0V82_005351 [Gnomoniopsis sp. IMI 355080]
MDPASLISTSALNVEKPVGGVLNIKDPASSDMEGDSRLKSPHSKRLATLRYTILNTYRRLFSLVLLGNIAALILIVRRRVLIDCINASAFNLLACGLARQSLVVNALFRLFCLVPRGAPLRLRHLVCKIFHIGGVHSGCGIAACLWYMGFFSLYCVQYDAAPMSTAVLVLATFVLVAFLVIPSVAHPALRRRFHDLFERTHRFGSWIMLGLFWALLLIFAYSPMSGVDSPGAFLVSLPGFWCLLLSTAATVQPWALLRRVDVLPEQLSTHAIRLHFQHTSIVYGQGISLSLYPLRDWHSFATITDRFDRGTTDTNNFSCLVSKAGDWTAGVIAHPPKKLWVRGVPVFGFGYVMRVFKRIIVVTTGSGIGPCLSFVDDDDRPAMRVVWQTRTPLKTYGQRTIDLVHRLDANPVVLDTLSQGRVDMLPIVRELWRSFEAEAVCVISNPAVTKRMVFELEKSGVRAYGPIFDS